MRATINSKGEVEITYREIVAPRSEFNIPEKEVPKVILEEFRNE